MKMTKKINVVTNGTNVTRHKKEEKGRRKNDENWEKKNRQKWHRQKNDEIEIMERKI